MDRSATSQEDLLVAFEELVSAPSSRHVTALALAAFVDIIIFLLAWASGPFFFGSPEERWLAAGAAVDAKDRPVFVRDLVCRLRAGPQGAPCLDPTTLSPGERQLCLVMASNGLAAVAQEEGRQVFLIDRGVHERLVESLADRSLALRAAAAPVAEG